APPQRPVNPHGSALPSAISTYISMGAVPPQTFAYDLGGNRTYTAERGAIARASIADADNRYTAVGGANWKHDADGQLLGDGEHAFRYDAEGALVEEFSDPNAGPGSAGVALLRDAY